MNTIQNKQRGQGMTEYIIIVALIAISAIAVYQYFGETVRNQTAGMAEELSGVANTGQAAAVISSGNAATKAKIKNTLDTYQNQNVK